MSTAKYFAIGFIFYFFIQFLYITMEPIMPFIIGIKISVLVMIGLLKGPMQGLAFGSANSFALTVFLLLCVGVGIYPKISPTTLYWYLSLSIFVTLPYMIYGYLPATLFRKHSKISSALLGFFISVLINSIFLLLIYGSIFWFLDDLLWIFILGILSISISSIKLRSKAETLVKGQEFSSVEVKLLVDEAKQRDFGKGIARINQNNMLRLGVKAGDIIEIIGNKTTAAAVWPAYKEDQNKDVIRLDEVMRRNAGAQINDHVAVRRAKVNEALSIVIAPLETRLNVDEDFTNFVKNRLMEKSLVEGNEILVTMLGHFIPFKVISTDPKGVIKVVSTTELKILESAISPLQENIVAQGVLETTERQKDNLVEASSKSVEKLEPIEKEVVEQTETTYQLQGVLVLPDQSELPIGLKRIIGREDLAKYVSPQKAWWISKEHCTIFQEGGSFYIEDKSSTNGTKLNGIEIRNMGKQKLNDNDEIIIADVIKILFKLKT
jgi:hypothetical protein